MEGINKHAILKKQPEEIITFENLKVELVSNLTEVYQLAECDQELEGSMEELQELVYDLEFRTDSKDDMILHWGLTYKGKSDWLCPPTENHPEESKVFDKKALQTFFSREDLKSIKIKIIVNLENNIQEINWVFYLPSKNIWFNNSNKNFSLKFKTIKKKSHLHGGDLNVPEFVEDIIKCEVEYGSWTLMHRYNKCFDILNQVELDNENLIWVYIWLRYNYIRVLDWQRRFNTKPRELAYSMNRLTQDITNKICDFLKNNKNHENEKFELSQTVLLRMLLSVLGKGTGDGQKIRDEILVILHKHHIKESNDHFYEQWHQKLHNNTTPDDIPICEAVIEYLKSGGKMETYWRKLNNYGVTKERLANFERKITSEPFYKPELIPDLENFLKILKAVHSSDDMILMFDSAKYALQGGDYMKFQDIISNKDHWDTLKQIERVTQGRRSLSNIILGSVHDVGRVRDLIFFDLCLETYLRQCVEKIIHVVLEFEHYITEVTAIVKNLNVTYNFRELRICLEDWVNICEVLKKNLQKNDKSYKAVISALKIKSVADRMSRTLTHIIDYFNTHYDPKARHLGVAFNAEKYIVDIFTEETIRGSIFFTLSMVLKKIEPILRSTANLGAWLIISRGKTLEPGREMVTGNVSFVKSLQEVQFKSYESPTILITEQVGGNEEVTPNVTCLIILNAKDYPDVLAHVSVRARNLGVPFLVCFDDNISENLRKCEKKYIGMKIVKQGLEIIENVEDRNHNQKISSNGSKKFDSNHYDQDSNDIEEFKQIQSVNIPEGFPKIIIHMSEFSKQYVGAKSNNTQKVFGNLPSWVKYPESMAIPFNVCEYFLEYEENIQIKEKLESLSKSLKSEKGSKISELLFECKKSLMTLTFIDNEETKLLKTELTKFGIKDTDFKGAWRAIKGVWCSKYNERAYIATKKVGIKLDDIRMAVLVQKIIPADFAFVIHTKNPSTDDENELYAEVVIGMGETLVGTYEGQSFAFTHNKKTGENVIHTFPNKSIVLKNKGYIFRSDSNTEDLEGFAGAGLFDSIPITEHQEVNMSYSLNEIFTDDKFVNSMMNKIAHLGIEVENIYNYPQDIEGVIQNNDYYIVQTRPQV